MSSQMPIDEQLQNVYSFLTLKASSRGLITSGRKMLAEEMGVPHIRFHRLVHRLVDEGWVKISGGGAHPKVMELLAHFEKGSSVASNPGGLQK